MKKLLSFLMMFTLFFGVGWAAETTFALSGYSSDFNYEGETKDGVTLAAAKGSGSSAPKYYTNNDAVRFYIGNTLTISSNNTITKIELTMGKTANVFSHHLLGLIGKEYQQIVLPLGLAVLQVSSLLVRVDRITLKALKSPIVKVAPHNPLPIV